MFVSTVCSTVSRRTLTKLLLGIMVVVAFTNTLNACFNPADINAIEVLFNKYGVEYNLTALIVKFKPVVVEEGRIYVFKYLYKTIAGEYLQFGVIVYIDRFCGDAPCVEGYNEDKPVRDVLAVRLEPLEECSSGSTTTTATSEKRCPEKSVMSSAFSELLGRLIGEGVIVGLGSEDVYMIMDAVMNNPVVAGWNNRLLYNEKLNRWAPYAELVYAELIKGVVVRGSYCSYKLPQEVVDEVKASEPRLIVEEGAPSTSIPPATSLSQTVTTVVIKEKETIIITITVTSVTPQPPITSVTDTSVPIPSVPPQPITSVPVTSITTPNTPPTKTTTTQSSIVPTLQSVATSSIQSYPSQSISTSQQYSNGLMMGISISIGVALALVTYIIWRFLSKV